MFGEGNCNDCINIMDVEFGANHSKKDLSGDNHCSMGLN